MKKRTAILGGYDTAAHGWTLAACKLGDPEQKTEYTEKPGGDGAWDISTVLTGGIPRYKNRPLNITLECSEGTRDDREDLINELVNSLDGLENKIVLPDRPEHYLYGRLHIAVDRSTLAHAIVNITGTMEPWYYKERETIVEIDATEYPQEHWLENNGRRAVVPVLSTDGSIQVTYKGVAANLDAGNAYQWPALLLTPGLHTIDVSGTGRLTVTYREAVLR